MRRKGLERTGEEIRKIEIGPSVPSYITHTTVWPPRNRVTYIGLRVLPEGKSCGLVRCAVETLFSKPPYQVEATHVGVPVPRGRVPLGVVAAHSTQAGTGRGAAPPGRVKDRPLPLATRLSRRVSLCW
jgi:hypothetical protein